MTEEQTQQVIDGLSALVERLGTTGERLWEVLVRQAPIHAAAELAEAAVCFVGVGLLVWLGYRAANRLETTKLGSADEGAWIYVVFVCLFGSIVLVLVGLFGIFDPLVWAGFLNPEYWALERVLEALR